MDLLPTLLAASAAAFGLAALSAVAGFGGGVLLLPVFTALFGLRVAVPMLTLTQISSNAFRAWLNRGELRWRLTGPPRHPRPHPTRSHPLRQTLRRPRDLPAAPPNQHSSDSTNRLTK